MDPSMGGPNSSPMGIVPGDQDPSMPLPPGGMNPGGLPPGGGPGGPNGGFSKNSPIMGVPTTTDPNYAQQYHNFQQQLYATNKNPGGPQFFPGSGGPGGGGGPNNGPGPTPAGAPSGPNGGSGGPPVGAGPPNPGGK